MYYVQITQNNDKALLKCNDINEAISVRQSFINYGKCDQVIILFIN
jgi:hypothetical protein